MKYEIAGYIAHSEISEECYKTIKSAKATCLFALELEEKLALLFDNYFEFETELLKLAEASRIWKRRHHEDSMLQRLTLDRRLVNLLTACRLYLDQTEHGISSQFGKPSAALTEVKSFKNNLYDDHWGYRFMEALRNHVQHSGLPVHTISYSSARIKGTSVDYGQFIIIPQSSAKKLAENILFKKAILTELHKMGDKIDLRPAVREYVECFAKLHEYLREKIAQKFVDNRAIYETAVNKHADKKLPRLVEKNDDGTTSEEVALVGDFLYLLDSYRTRNITNPNLARSFAANTSQERD